MGSFITIYIYRMAHFAWYPEGPLAVSYSWTVNVSVSPISCRRVMYKKL